MLLNFQGNSDESVFNIDDQNVEPVKELKSLGVPIDECFYLKKQISLVCSASFGCLKKLYNIRKYLSFEDSSKLARILINSRLDNWNSTYSIFARRQNLQTLEGEKCFIFGCHKASSIRLFLQDLHWLPLL